MYQDRGVDGRRHTLTAYMGVEFEIDGRSFSHYVVDVETRSLVSDRVTLFNTGLAEPAAILLQRSPFDPDSRLLESGRTQVLMCGCGDPYCGALMARISIRDDRVTWSDWAWDDFEGPAIPESQIPDFHFDLRQYRKQLEWAENASVDEQLVAVLDVRVARTFLDYLDFRRGRVHADVRQRLRAMDVRASVLPQSRIAREYAAFLNELSQTQTQVHTWYSSHGEAHEVQREKVILGMENLLKSPFTEHLPRITVDAIGWIISDLRTRSAGLRE